jgi:hypothetical protein
MGKRLDIPVGTRFGKLEVIGEGEPKAYGKDRPSRTLRCRCECGNVVDVTVRKLVHLGQISCSRSCGNTKHGLARRSTRDPIYNCWQSIWARTNNPKATGYKYWGGRGIRMHEPWKDPAVFKAEVEAEIGLRPSQDMSVERIDVNGHYVPGNIMWLPKSKQPLSRRPVYNSTDVEAMLAAHHCACCSRTP